GRERVRDVVVPGDHEERPAEAPEERRRAFVLAATAAVRQVARDGDQLGRDALDQRHETRLYRSFLHASRVQIGDVEEPCSQRRSSLNPKTRAEESAKFFLVLSLGRRAGAAWRRRRGGEPLTTEDQEALGRWARLSSWRKALAIGAFSVGTFG